MERDFVYASCEDGVRKNQWKTLLQLNPGDVGWSIMGDFNDILESAEKKGDNMRSEARMSTVRDFIRDGGLLDLGHTRDSFNWCNSREKQACIKARLDRVLCNAHWCLTITGAVVYHLDMIGADHKSDLLDTEGVTEKAKRRFVFDKGWVMKAGCEEVVREAWKRHVEGSRWLRVCEKIKHVRMALVKWCRENNFNARIRIDDIQAKLRVAYEGDNFDRGMAGDKNTHFFHASTMIRRQQNKLRGFENEVGQWVEGAEQVENVVVDYFEQIFKANEVCTPEKATFAIGDRDQATN
ncbi:hypothetical protein LIER_29368 [Lithospermum erythrorhizon]|uniref:Reverse transcriptase n=1 Tax=Lithospermum erythrorhizon TaxID=34254 RepID=A0AAV3RIW1_LITER